MARPRTITSLGETVYLPSVYDPKKIREGLIEIINCVQNLELKDKSKRLTLEDKEMPISDD